MYIGIMNSLDTFMFIGEYLVVDKTLFVLDILFG